MHARQGRMRRKPANPSGPASHMLDRLLAFAVDERPMRTPTPGPHAGCSALASAWVGENDFAYACTFDQPQGPAVDQSMRTPTSGPRAGFYALASVSAGMFTVLKNLSNLMTIVGDWYFFDKTYNWQVGGGTRARHGATHNAATR